MLQIIKLEQWRTKQHTLFILSLNEPPKISEFSPSFVITIISTVGVFLCPVTPKHMLPCIYTSFLFLLSLYLCLFSAKLCSTLLCGRSLPIDSLPLSVHSSWHTGTEIPLLGTDMLSPSSPQPSTATRESFDAVLHRIFTCVPRRDPMTENSSCGFRFLPYRIFSTHIPLNFFRIQVFN